MMNWFGPQSWGALICTDTPRCDIPAGVRCCRCQLAITESDSGVTVPGSDGPVTYHLDCFLKSITPHSSWETANLIPTEADGLKDGKFECCTCGVCYQVGIGWLRKG